MRELSQYGPLCTCYRSAACWTRNEGTSPDYQRVSLVMGVRPIISGVARPIAKRRAGLLGWVASPNGGINSLVLASGCCPVRFDLDRSLFSGPESKAADRSVRSTQTSPPRAPPIHDRSRGECLGTSPGVSDV